MIHNGMNDYKRCKMFNANRLCVIFLSMRYINSLKGKNSHDQEMVQSESNSHSINGGSIIHKY